MVQRGSSWYCRPRLSPQKLKMLETPEKAPGRVDVGEYQCPWAQCPAGTQQGCKGGCMPRAHSPNTHRDARTEGVLGRWGRATVEGAGQRMGTWGESGAMGSGVQGGLQNSEQEGEEQGIPTPPQAPPSLPERGLHMSLPLLSSASAGAGTSLRVLWKGERAAALGPGAGGSSSSLEGELEGELGWQGSHSAGPRGAPGAWQLLPGRSAFCPLCSSPALAASVGGRPRVTMVP